jgi:ubiquinone/menaquinone biosynthesis C-methylase UbiE
MQTASLGHERTALRDSIVRANVAVHSKLADSYDLQEPHFRPENRDKVRAILKQLRSRAPGGRLLDLGCGTGFILNLASDLFDELHGIDATPAMLARIGDNTGKIKLHVGIAEQVDFPDNSFDVVTAYSFLHHTLEYADVMREALRVLRPGGLFYVDLEPNQLFWKAISGLKTCEGEYFAPAVEREIDAVLHTDAKLER